MKRLCLDITDGILVYGDSENNENLLVLDYDRNNEGKFRVFYESVDGFLTQMVENLEFKNAIVVYHLRLEVM